MLLSLKIAAMGVMTAGALMVHSSYAAPAPKASCFSECAATFAACSVTAANNYTACKASCLGNQTCLDQCGQQDADDFSACSDADDDCNANCVG